MYVTFCLLTPIGPQDIIHNSNASKYTPLPSSINHLNILASNSHHALLQSRVMLCICTLRKVQRGMCRTAWSQYNATQKSSSSCHPSWCLPLHPCNTVCHDQSAAVSDLQATRNERSPLEEDLRRLREAAPEMMWNVWDLFAAINADVQDSVREAGWQCQYSTLQSLQAGVAAKGLYHTSSLSLLYDTGCGRHQRTHHQTPWALKAAPATDSCQCR